MTSNIFEEQGHKPNRRAILIKDSTGRVLWQRICEIHEVPYVLSQAEKVAGSIALDN